MPPSLEWRDVRERERRNVGPESSVCRQTSQFKWPACAEDANMNQWAQVEMKRTCHTFICTSARTSTATKSSRMDETSCDRAGTGTGVHSLSWTHRSASAEVDKRRPVGKACGCRFGPVQSGPRNERVSNAVLIGGSLPGCPYETALESTTRVPIYASLCRLRSSTRARPTFSRGASEERNPSWPSLARDPWTRWNENGR
ncbi:hypothetical protein HD554DRAFT_555382 [Boletus coccyginus]|nr:hypothetical protein HD554DRAFT_555382 [Boletus coccyginus]